MNYLRPNFIRNHLFSICSAAGVVLLFSAAPAIAVPEIEQNLPEIKINATRTPDPIHLQTGSVTVITQEELQKKKHFQIKDILREQVGISEAQTGSFGSTSSIFMRGANSDSTLVMIDGVQVNSTTSGAYDFGQLNSDNIERIEILRGIQSTLWGSDAVGGVINIITKKGTGLEPEHSFSFEGGTYDTFKKTIQSAGDLGFLDYSASASRTDTEGFSSFNHRRGGEEKDGFEQTTVSTQVGTDFLEDGRVDFISRYMHSNTAFDSSFGDASFQHLVDDQWVISVPVTKNLFSWWRTRLNLNYGQDELTNRSAFPSTIITRTYTADFQNNFQIGEYFSAVAGFEHQTTNGQNFSSNFKGQNHAQGYYFQATGNYKDRLILTGGFRQTVNSRFDDALTYKFEGAYRLNEYGTKIRGARATGFRVPTFNQILFPFVSNPNLTPEESDSWEVGIQQTFLDGKIVIDSTYFEADYDNLIVFDLTNFTFQQIGQAESNGFETTGKFQLLENLNLSVTHTYLDARNTNANVQLARRPENIYTVNLFYNCGDKFSALFGVTTRGSSFSTDVGNNRVSGNSVGRMVLNYKTSDNLSFSVRVENLWDEAYELAQPFGTPGLAAYFGFTYRIR